LVDVGYFSGFSVILGHCITGVGFGYKKPSIPVICRLTDPSLLDAIGLHLTYCCCLSNLPSLTPTAPLLSPSSSIAVSHIAQLVYFIVSHETSFVTGAFPFKSQTLSFCRRLISQRREWLLARNSTTAVVHVERCEVETDDKHSRICQIRWSLVNLWSRTAIVHALTAAAVVLYIPPQQHTR